MLRPILLIVSLVILVVGFAVVLTVLVANEELPAADDVVMVSTLHTTRSTHRISPLIYGVSWADAAAAKDLRLTFNRWGGNATSRYNWQENCQSHTSDWFFESLPRPGAEPGAEADDFIKLTRAGGGLAGITIPTLDWIAKLGPQRSRLSSFSVVKYGPQQQTDQWFPDAGNGRHADGSPITGNDPADANVRNSPAVQAAWMNHLRETWGNASAGGVKHFFIDNEPCLWHETHRDVHPHGAAMEEMRDRFITYATMVRKAEPDAQIIGPELWGYLAWISSGLDQAQAKNGGPRNADRKAHDDLDFMPWFLRQIATHQRDTNVKILDVLTTHIYPQAGEFSDDVSPAMCERRNRSTRILWDPTYVDDSWIGKQGIKVAMIPRFKKWIADESPGLQLGLTEYSWGADQHMNGATAQADVLGILGRENLHMAARWTCPKAGTPVYQVIKLMRNADGNGGGFGDWSLAIDHPDPDRVSLFAAVRSSDGALTILMVNKTTDVQRVTINADHGSFPTVAQSYIVRDGNSIQTAPVVLPTGTSITLSPTSRSVTLLVVPDMFPAGTLTAPPP